MVSVGWHHMGLDLRDGGLHVVLVLVVKPLLAGLVCAAGPHVNLAGGGGLGQYSYGVHLRVHGLCPALEVRLGIFLELNLPNLIQ